MKKYLCYSYMIAILSVSALPQFIYAETPEEYNLKDAELTTEIAQKSLGNIDMALKEYRNFSEIILNEDNLKTLKAGKNVKNIELEANKINKYESIDWSVQNIGFKNWTLVVKGVLLKNDFLTKKYKLELAKCSGKNSEAELEKMNENMKIAKEEYYKFLSEEKYSD